MKKSDGLLILIVITFWSVILMAGFIKTITTFMKPKPQPTRINPALVLEQQRERTRDIRETQKRHMADQRRKIEEHNRRMREIRSKY